MELMSIVILLGVLIVVFLLFREVNLWYFKINESIELQRESVRLLKLISGENTSNKEKEFIKEYTIETMFRETKENKTLRIVSKNNITIGAEVFIKDEKAPDGKYEYLNENRRIIVKDGRIGYANFDLLKG
jgi:hypothetical protein